MEEILSKKVLHNFSTNAHHLVEPSTKIVNNIKVNCWAAKEHLGHTNVDDFAQKKNRGEWDLFMFMTIVIVSILAV